MNEQNILINTARTPIIEFHLDYVFLGLDDFLIFNCSFGQKEMPLFV